MSPIDKQITRRKFLQVSVGTAATFALPGTLSGNNRPPNFVIIYADDLGYNDLSCYGSQLINTPRLDRMAAEGIKFTDFYSAAAVCTPSRAALLTGCYPIRVNLPSVLGPFSNIGISNREITLAELLKTKGYATACIGKWHLGDQKPFLPTRHGFDYYYGLPYSNDMPRPNWPVPLIRNEKIIEQPAVQETLTERYTREAIEFIRANRNQPLFLYLAHTMPHVPLSVSKRFAGRSKRGLYGDVVECIDWSTGEILDTLTKLGLEENTLVVFSSDNGPWLSQKENGGSARPLRDGKGTTWEGGMRVPGIAWWPGRIPAGIVCREVVSTIDIYPTFAALADAKLPEDRIIDGKDVRPLLFGQKGALSPHKAFFYYWKDELQAVRSGRWKLVLEHKTRDGKTTIPQQLFDLETDIGETTDVSQQYPSVVKRLMMYVEEMREDLGDALVGMPAKNSRPCGRIK
ncbi:MAG: sulfatase family protein [Armatimonadota bacterium]